MATVTCSPSSTAAPLTLTTGPRYSSRLIRALPNAATARFHSTIPATELPRARKPS
jgi:hypothetical protein